MAEAKRDNNYVPTLLAVSNADETTPVPVQADPVTGRILVSATGGGGAAITDDAAFTAGTTEITPVGGFFDDVAPDSVNEGDAGAFRMSANRNLYATIRDAAGNERGVNVTAGNALTVDGSAVTQPVSAATLPLPTGAATLAEQQTQTASLSVLDDWDNAASDGASVSGDVAHDSADAGEPVKVGAKAETSLSGVTLVADGDRTDLYAGVDGVQIVRPHTNLEDLVSGVDTDTDASSTAVIAAQGAGIKVYVTDVTIANSSATNVTVDLRDGTAGSVKWTFPVPANGGVTMSFTNPLGFSANTAVAVDPSAAASTITTSVLGFKSKI